MCARETAPTAEPTNEVSTSLLDLNDDCLLKIFRILSLADVSRVAEVCHTFRDLATETFKYEWKNKTIRLSNKTKETKVESTAILRNFGTQIQKVQIVFDQHVNDTFFNLIIDKCSVQLTMFQC